MNRRINGLVSSAGMSLIDMLIAMLIAFVLFISVGVMSRISVRTHTKYYNEAQIHTDISYGFKLIRRYVRESGFVKEVAPGGSWVGDRMRVGHRAFGLYQTASSVDFVFMQNIGDETKRDVILSVPNSDTVSLTLTPEAAASPKFIDVRIQGQKDRIPFDMTMKVMERG